MNDIDRDFIANAVPICDKNLMNFNLKYCQCNDYKSSKIWIRFGSFRNHFLNFYTSGTPANAIFGTDLTRKNFPMNWCNSGSPMYSF